MRGAWIFALAVVAGGAVACLATIDESRLNAKDDPVDDDDDDDKDGAPPKPGKDSGPVADQDASVTPTTTPDGGLSCPEPTSLCAGRCYDLATSNSNCGSCGNACGVGTSCTTKACRASSCKDVLAQKPGSPTGATTIGFQGQELTVFCDQTTRQGGWTMLHRLSAGPGLTGDPLTFYTTIPLNDLIVAEASPRKTTTHYTSRLLGQWNTGFPVREVMLRVYDSAGNGLKEVIFDGADTTFLSFMTPAKIKASSWTDLTGAGEFSDFGVDGSAGIQRRFLLHKKYNICPEDTGWLIVHGTPADVPCKTEYESPFDRIRIVFAPGTTSQLWTQGVGEASSFAVFVR